MTLVLTTVVLLAVLLLYALYAEDVAPEPEPVRLPPWDGLPSPSDIRRADFPLALGGYDRAAVEAHLARVSVAFEALLTARGSVDAMWRAAQEPDEGEQHDEVVQAHEAEQPHDVEQPRALEQAHDVEQPHHVAQPPEVEARAGEEVPDDARAPRDDEA